MALLEGELWLGNGVLDRTLLCFGKPSEAGHAPYNIELLASGEGRPKAVRSTLAIAGLGLTSVLRPSRTVS
jgi:hypothetical protein